MRLRVALFAERLFAVTHVALGDLFSHLAARWDLTLHAREVLQPAAPLPQVRLVSPPAGDAFDEEVARSSVICWLASASGVDLGQALLRACSRAGLPLAAGLGGSEVHGLASGGAGARELAAVLAGTHLILVNVETQKRLLIRAGFDARRIAVVPPGLPIERYRERPSPPEGPFQVGFIGRFSPRKNVLAGFAAFVRVAAELPESRFIAIGDGADRERLLEAVEASGLEARCEMPGILPHARVLEILHNLSVLCLPGVADERARAGGLPFILLESQAVGVPVVAADAGGTAEGIVHEETGLLISGDDPKELAGSLLRLARDPGLQRSMGRAGRAWIEQRFDLRQVVERYDDLCRSLLER
jgi:glycosyltransferase involved in cell wall biosynthesis